MNEDNIGDIQAEFEGPGEPGIDFPWDVPAGATMCAARVNVSLTQHSGLASLAAGTPYEGGLFRMRLTVPPDFPNTAPKGARHADS